MKTIEELIDKVARALCRADKEPEDAWAYYYDLAKAAIEAMKPDPDPDAVEVRVAVAVSSYEQDGETIYDVGTCAYEASGQLDDEWAIDEARACLGEDRPTHESVVKAQICKVRGVPVVEGVVGK